MIVPDPRPLSAEFSGPLKHDGWVPAVPDEWEPVPGYENAYQVSSDGRVFSVRAGREMKPWLSTKGYPTVSLRKDGKKRNVTVHHLVLTAFIGPRPDGTEGCHRNDERLDNRVDNLYWGTRSQNLRDRRANGRDQFSTKTTCPRGHKLLPPNLVAYRAKKGIRSCLACYRAYGVAAKHRGPFNPELAHANYQKLRPWTDLTDAEHEQHRAECGPANGGPCALCEEHREFGGCPACGDTSAEIVEDKTLCCGVRGLQGVEFDRWAA